MFYFDYYEVKNDVIPENETKIVICDDHLVYINSLPKHVIGLNIVCPDVRFTVSINDLIHLEELCLIQRIPNEYLIENLKYMTNLKKLAINFPVTHDIFPPQLTQLYNVDYRQYNCVLPNITRIVSWTSDFENEFYKLSLFPNVVNIQGTIKITDSFENNFIEEISLDVEANYHQFRVTLPKLKKLSLYCNSFSEDLNKSMQYLFDHCHLESLYLVLHSSEGVYVLNLPNVKNYEIRIPSFDTQKNVHLILNGKLIIFKRKSSYKKQEHCEGVLTHTEIGRMVQIPDPDRHQNTSFHDDPKIIVPLITVLRKAKEKNDADLYIECFSRLYTATNDEIRHFFKLKLLTDTLCFDYLWFNTSQFVFDRLCRKTNMIVMLKSLIIEDKNLFKYATLINMNYLVKHCPELKDDLVLNLLMSHNDLTF